ncbi:MAG: hypothetical protein KBT20_03805 [Bacteroidales bacterium]|nr:hypothetical protein [Candidatus Liminaster caballi]
MSHAIHATSDDTNPSLHALPADCPQTNDMVDAFERFRREQIAQFEDDITEGRCFPEMPEGQFVRSK